MGSTGTGEEGGGDINQNPGSGGGLPPPAPPPPGEDRDITGEQRWRRKAQEAEALAQQLRERLAVVSEELAACREALDACERRHNTDLALLEAGAVDLETARLLTEAAVERMSGADVATAVADLRRSKPFLFRRAREPGAAQRDALAGMAASSVASPAGDEASAALEAAALTGDRAALLRYLRLRRH